MIYTMLLLIGAIGLLAMALMGMGHTGVAHHVSTGAGHLHAAAHGAHAHHTGANARSGQTPQKGSSGEQAAPGWRSQAGGMLLTVLSPLTIFSLLLGTGVVGVLLQHRGMAAGMLAAAAIAGGLAFYGLLTRPLMNLMFRFASIPIEALEGATASTAEALTPFDVTGKGMVRLVVDGQIVRILARLDSDDAPQAAEVRPGDKLMVTAVDPRRNTCRVARL